MMEIEIIRSEKRKKTIEAVLKDGKLIIKMPKTVSKADEARIVKDMKQKILARKNLTDLNTKEKLAERAEMLNRKYFKGNLRISSVKFVNNQNSRFGSCTVTNGEIRISEKLSKTPPWVLDYVLIHEMSHLIHPDHSRAFWECVYRFPLAERARGYLIAVAYEEDDVKYGNLEN